MREPQPLLMTSRWTYFRVGKRQRSISPSFWKCIKPLESFSILPSDSSTFSLTRTYALPIHPIPHTFSHTLSTDRNSSDSCVHPLKLPNYTYTSATSSQRTSLKLIKNGLLRISVKSVNSNLHSGPFSVCKEEWKRKIRRY